ncbi:Multidrug resistance-associated ABC transporter [Mycena venus]|uniref:Multidrug resistance-associated ABC transporter n=1 Tax=Mycena venus TaxID=2733690 RepID=A0A8H6Y479_9AGAR|nr:Multidrug resistance-associated ABC transporter [Mycena venus]
MALILCPNSEPNPLAFDDPCVRASWSALLPAILVVALCIASLPFPAILKQYSVFLFKPFQEFLTVEEAEALCGASLSPDVSPPPGSRGTTTVLASLAFVEVLLWVGVGIFEVASGTLGTGKVLPFLFATSWCYAFVLPLVTSPIITAPITLFWLFLIEFTGAVVLLGGVLLGYGKVTGIMVVVCGLNMVLTASLLVVVLQLPLGVQTREPLEGELERSPEDYTSLFGWITFAWVYPLIRRGTNNTLTEQDVWNLSPTMQTRPVFHKFTQLKRATLLGSIWAANSLDLSLDACLSVVTISLNFGAPFFMNLILATLEQPAEGGQRLAYLYAFLAFACQIIRSEADGFHSFYGRRASTRMKTELMTAIYDKALKRCDFIGIVDVDAKAEAKLAKDAKSAKRDGKSRTIRSDGKHDEDLGPKAGAQLGKIVNLMSVDATTVSIVPFYMFFIYSAPFQIGLSLLFLSSLLGWAAFAGVAFVLLSIPVNWFIAKLNVKYEKGIVTVRDKRTSVVNELISSIKFIKFGGAEERWLKKANDAREIELGWLLKERFMDIAFSITWMLLPLLISVSSFYVYVKQGNELTVSTAFTAGVALSRISKFLDEEEVSEQVSALKSIPTELDETATPGLAIQNGSFSWNELPTKVEPNPSEVDADEETRFELRDISISFPEGKLTCVVGPTASGKTALLQALLGEMTCLPGTKIKPPKSSKVDENGLMQCMSYAAQTPWLQYASIKDNIIFGFPYDEERYQSVLEACALLPDLAILPDGDRTEIGVRGVTLSGGQKARVALARAVYAWTKYVLLDDPLSAVDSHTSRVLFDKLFCGPLLKNRTVVLVTHHIDLLLSGNHGSGAQYIVRMLDGRIDTQGTVQELRARGLLEAIKQDLKYEAPGDATTAKEKDYKTEAKPASSQPITKLVEDEEQAKGDVEWHIYKTYLKASSYKVWAIILMFIVFYEMLLLGQRIWMKIWGEAYETPSFEFFSLFLSQGNHQTPMITSVPFTTSLVPVFEFPSAHDNPMFYVAIYAGIGLGVNFVNTLISILEIYGSLRASRHLFRTLLMRLAYSTFRWFDATPKGRILNRIGKDISTVDTKLSQSMKSLIYLLGSLAVAILTVTVVFPYFLVPAALLSFAYYKLSVGYLHSSRDLRRMEANTRSPIFTGFSELLEGIVTVRAFGVEKRFLHEMYGKIDLTTRLGYSYWQENRWLLLNFNYLGAGAVLLASLFSVSSFVSAGLAGICIVSANNFSRLSFSACRSYTELQVDLNAVERVVNYLEIPQEPPAIIESNRPPAYWPSSSSNINLLVVEDLEVKYAPNLPSVLHHISFALKARERVGVLGRTGSGKSTLATSLLRFVEPTSGRIIIDGIDISTIGINDLRTRLTFIPQDATLFSGTLRDNLDPFDEYEDAELESALFRVHLLSRSAYQSQRTSARASPVAELESEPEAASVSGFSSVTEVDSKAVISLDTMVSAEGANFSHGQRQLIALARALLRQSSIIILDEATSSIDFETDRKIQRTIREEFNHSLLLTIAHRIKTVIDYDRLLILDQGKIAQFDTPYNLIRSEGIFREMCKKTGSFSELEAAAKGGSSV